MTFGDIPPDRIVAHSCDNRPCCNPAHLSCETQQQNTRDMVDRGLHPYMASERYRVTRESWWRHGANGSGETNANAKLTNDQVREIRRAYADDGMRQVDLARQFGVGQTTISRILRQERYRDGGWPWE